VSLRWRLALILGVVVAATVALAASTAYVATARELRSAVDRSLVLETEDVETGRPTPPGRPARRSFPADVQVIGAEGVIENQSGLAIPVDDVDLEVASGDRRRALRTVTIDGSSYRLLTQSRGPVAIQAARDLTDLNDTLDGLRNRLLAVGLLGTAGAALVGWVVASGFTRPIRRLTRATGEIAELQEPTDPIPVDRSDEVGELAASFNTMTAALAQSRKQQQQLVMDASHELRTPLTTLRANIELLRRADELPADDRRAALDTANAELEELSDLVAELVELATEQRTDRVDFVDVPLGPLVQAVVDRARRRTGRAVGLTIDRPAAVRGAPERLTRALSNLLDNADKFSPPDTDVEVSVRETSVAVADHGPGVAPPDRERIFDRFYRADTARTQPGSGLGLAIVAQVAAEHGGDVRVDETPGGGATFTLRLPPL
jgi:two-component system sensor histidine kinase MprB